MDRPAAGSVGKKGKTMIRTATLALGVIFGVLSTAAPGLTQTALGTLRGVALDQQGGVLPGVTITIRQVDTNTVQTAVSGAEGQYFLPNLRPGRYEVTAELSGFAPTRQQLELRVGQDLTVNLAMRLGNVAEQVDVVARSVAVETQSTLATVITNKQIDDLPTVTRDFSALATISPGAWACLRTSVRRGGSASRA